MLIWFSKLDRRSYLTDPTFFITDQVTNVLDVHHQCGGLFILSFTLITLANIFPTSLSLDRGFPMITLNFNIQKKYFQIVDSSH